MTTNETKQQHRLYGMFGRHGDRTCVTKTHRVTGQTFIRPSKPLTRYQYVYAVEHAARRSDGTTYRYKELFRQLSHAQKWLAALTTALALVAIPTFAHPVYPPDDYLARCTIAHYDDGSRVAECPEDGAVLVYDADGNRYVNESGAPIHGAGWYVIE